jgi:hypothetical protein
MFDDEVVGRSNCCDTPSPCPDDKFTWHSPDCMLKSYYKNRTDGSEKLNKFTSAAKYEKYRLVPRPATPDPDMPTWTGWVAPNGDFYSCDYAGHRYLADRIVLALKIGEEWRTGKELLIKAGWVEVHGANWKEKTDHFIYIDSRFDNKPTAAQVNTLFDLALKHDNMKAFEQFKELYCE